jgi:hypothetical protein
MIFLISIFYHKEDSKTEFIITYISYKMAFELNGMLFNVELETDYQPVLNLVTNTPCCPDICYFGYFNKEDSANITEAVKAKQVSLQIIDGDIEKVEFKYWLNKDDEKTILLEAGARYEEGIYENVKRVKAYFALVKELADTKEELAAAYKELDGIIECEGLFPRQPWKRS